MADSALSIVAICFWPRPLLGQRSWAAWIVRSVVVQCGVVQHGSVWCSVVQRAAACLDYEFVLQIKPSFCKAPL